MNQDFMADVKEILSGIVTEFHIVPYLVIAGTILLFSWGIWWFAKHEIRSPIGRRIFLSLLLALALAPSVFGFDMGAFTVPALFMLFWWAISGLRLVGVIFAMVSICICWALIFCGWSAVNYWFRHTKKNNHPTS